MSKINCDVCGTAYPETANQCPICGCVRPGEGITDQIAAERSSYTYVKGGRFSKANVRKRNQSSVSNDEAAKQETEEDIAHEHTEKVDKGLVAAICALLLAIVAVVIYIVMQFYAADPGTENKGGQVMNPSDEIEIATTLPPEETETVPFTKPDESVLPTEGETTPATEPTTLPTENNNIYVEPYTLSTEKRKNDVTIFRKKTFDLKLFDATGELMDVDWKVADPDICSVEGNTVTGLKVGKTDVYVEINGKVYSCIVRVKA